MASDFDPYHRWLGIPPEEQPPDHYRLLGVRRFETDAEVISNASDQRMAHLRTFASGQRSRESQKLLNEVSAATRCLLDPAKRTEYDSELRRKEVVRSMPIAQAIPLSMPPMSYSAMTRAAAPQSSLPVAMQVEAPFPHATVTTTRRSVDRRKTSSNLGLIIGAVAGGILLVGGALVAYQMSRPAQVVKQAPSTNEKEKDKATSSEQQKNVVPDPGRAKVAATSDERQVWFYANHEGKEGFLRPAGNAPSGKRAWQETHGGQPKFRYEEVDRTDDYVELKQLAGNLRLRLFADRVEAMLDGVNFKRAQDGKWVKPGELQSLVQQARSTNADPRTVWFYPAGDDGKSRGIYQRVDAKQWEQTETSGKRWRFDHVETTKDYIALHETRVNVDLRIFADHVKVRKGDEWVKAQSGVWIKKEDIARLMNPSAPVVGQAGHGSVPKLAFNGNNKGRLTSNLTLVSTDEPFTVDFWFRRGDKLEKPAGLIRIGQLSISLGAGPINGMQTPWCEIHTPEKYRQQPHNVAPDRQWHHFAVAHDEDSKLFVYLDGKMVLVASFSDLGVSELNPIEIGVAEGHEGELTFQGQVHSVRFTDKSLFPGGQEFTQPNPRTMDLPPDVRLVMSGINAPSSVPQPVPRPMPNTTAPAVEVPTVARTAVPTGDSLKAAEEKVKGAYGAKIKSAQKPEDKVSLAREIYTTSSTETDANVAYVLLSEAQDLAALGGDVALCLEIVSDADRRFEIDHNTHLIELFEKLAPRSNLSATERETVVREAMTHALTVLREENLPIAEKFAAVATKAATKGRDPVQRKGALALLDHVRTVKSAWEAKQQALSKLEGMPEDPAANLTVGRFYAFFMSDFAKAARYLAKSSDAKLAEAGRKQLAADETDQTEAKFAAAKAWSQLLEDLKPAEKLAVQRHVLAAMTELEPKLAGVDKSVASDQIKVLKPIVEAADKANPLLAKQKLAPGLIARLVADVNRSVPTPGLAVARDEQDLYRISTARYVQMYGASYPRYSMAGMLSLDKDSVVFLQFDDCTCRIGTQLFHADYRSPVNGSVRLKKGNYPVVLWNTSSGFRFRVTDDTGKNLLMHDERVLEMESQRVVLLPNGSSTKTERLDANRVGFNGTQ